MKKFLLTATALLGLAALGGCASPYPGVYSSGAWAGYDGGFDDGYHGYQRPVIYDNFGPYGMGVSYAPPPYTYMAPARGYPSYGPQTSGWYSTYYCPPQMQVGGY
jgi:hypothetical protein